MTTTQIKMSDAVEREALNGARLADALTDLGEYTEVLALNESHDAHEHDESDNDACWGSDVIITFEREARIHHVRWSAGDGQLTRVDG